MDVDSGPVEAAVASADAQLSAVGRLMDEAPASSATGPADPAMLKDLNMSPAQFTDFVRKYTDRFDKLPLSDRTAPQPTAVEAATAKRAGSGELRLGAGETGTVAGAGGQGPGTQPAHTSG